MLVRLLPNRRGVLTAPGVPKVLPCFMELIPPTLRERLWEGVIDWTTFSSKMLVELESIVGGRGGRNGECDFPSNLECEFELNFESPTLLYLTYFCHRSRLSISLKPYPPLIALLSALENNNL